MQFDRDGSGSIDVDELTELVSHLGVDMSDNEISAAMNYMDADRSDRIEWGEFHEWWSREDQMSFV